MRLWDWTRGGVSFHAEVTVVLILRTANECYLNTRACRSVARMSYSRG